MGLFLPVATVSFWPEADLGGRTLSARADVSSREIKSVPFYPKAVSPSLYPINAGRLYLSAASPE
ncbi:hypothetical protein EMIT0215P_50122 [Pseudomonas serboccidentalis]